MAFTQVAAPNLSALVSGNANLYLLQALGFTGDSRLMLVHGSFADSAVQPAVTQQAIWLYDVNSRSYTSNLSTLLTSDTTALRELDLRDASIAGTADRYSLVIEHQMRGSTEAPQLAWVKDGVLIQRDLLSNLLGNGAQVRAERYELSADGRYLAIQTSSALLAKNQEPDTNEASDIYLIDLNNLSTQGTPSIQRVSAMGSFEVRQASFLGGIYADTQGVSVLFATEGSFSSKDQNSEDVALIDRSDAYLWHSQHTATGLQGTPSVNLVSSQGASGLAAGGVDSEGLWVTASGAIFNSSASGLTPNDNNQASDAFFRTSDRTVSKIALQGVSELAQGAQALSSSNPGNLQLLLTELPEDTTMGVQKLVLIDTRDDTWTVVSEKGRVADDSAFAAKLSPNGAVLAFNSKATNLVTGQDNSAIGGQLFLTETGLLDVINSLPAGTVSFSGTAIQGQVLTAANTLADNDGLGEISYQWLANGVNIIGAITSTFTLTQAQVGKTISVLASYTDLQGSPESVTSTASAEVANVNDLPSGSVTIAGIATQDQVLTAANTLADIDGLGTISYQWMADGVKISEATKSTFTLTQAQVGEAITVTASYTDGFGQAESVTSVATTNVTNVNDLPTGSVTIAGIATQGQVLTATNTLADIDGLGTISYQWLADGVNISEATKSTFTLTQAQVGQAVTVTASYTDGFGQAESVTSAATSTVANINDLPTGSVTITGIATPGQSLTATNTLADIDGLGTVKYQWLANGTIITDATSNTFLITQDLGGQQISVRASYTDKQGTAESVDSDSIKINTPPVARDNSYSILEDDTQVLGNLITDGWEPGTAGETLFRDTDADGDTLSISAITVSGVLTAWANLPNSTDPADLADALRGNEWKAVALPNGTAWLQSTGELRYAGKANDTLGDTLGYTITDGQGGTASAQVQIKVTPIDDPSTATLSVSGSAKTGGSLSLNVSNITDPDGIPTLAYQWQWLSNQTWQDIEGATSDTWAIPTAGLWADRAVRAQLSTTDPLGGKSVFHSDAQTIEASSQLVLSAAHWKSGKALPGVGVGLFDGATEFKTGSDGTLNAQGFQDPDGVDDGQTVLNPSLAADPKQASITLTDVLGALKVYLGKPLPEAYNKDLKFIAADFDGNGTVNLTDVLGLLKFYLNKPVNAAPAWVFVDSAQTTTVNGQTLHLSNKAGQTLSTTASAPSPILADLNSDESVQLLGVLRRDVDGSWLG